MRKALYYGAALAAMATIASAVVTAKPALSQGFAIERHCTDSKFYGRNCRTTVQPIAAPRELTPEEIAERAARTAKWEEFCKPTLGPADNEGIRRYRYAHTGCDVGRDE